MRQSSEPGTPIPRSNRPAQFNACQAHTVAAVPPPQPNSGRKMLKIVGAVVALLIVASTSLGHYILLHSASDTEEGDEAAFNPLTRKTWGEVKAVLGGMHVLGKRDVPAPTEIKALDTPMKKAWLPREMGKRIDRHHHTSSTSPNTSVVKASHFCPVIVWEGSGSGSGGQLVDTLSIAAKSVIYKMEGPHYAQLHTAAGAHGEWVKHLTDAVRQEFGLSIKDVGGDVPLLQPLWGTMAALSKWGLSSRTLSAPPALPAPNPNSCESSQRRPLVILPTRWARRANVGGHIPLLHVPDSIAINLLSLIADAIQGEGSVSPTFAVPIFAEGNSHVVGGLVRGLELGGSEVWRLLGVSNPATVLSLFKAAMTSTDAQHSAHVSFELKRNGNVKVLRIRPECGGGECDWCDEVTAVVPLVAHAEIGGRAVKAPVVISLTEIVCAGGGTSPEPADSLATAVHIGALVGNSEAATHVIVLDDEYVAHSLSEQGGDRWLFRDGLQGGVGTVGSGFFDQIMAPWANSGCQGPQAAQAIVLRRDSIQARSAADLAFATRMSDLVVDSHGYLFADKALAVPSFPSSGATATTGHGANCNENHPCVSLADILNSMFHPFTKLEGITPIKRHHAVPGRSRRVLGIANAAERRDVLGPARWGYTVEAIDAVSPRAVCVQAASFAKINGLFGKMEEQAVGVLVEDAAAALRARLIPFVSRWGGGGRGCQGGEDGVVGSVLRAVRAVTRRVVGVDMSHALTEEHFHGTHLSLSLRDLAPSKPAAPLDEGRFTMGEVAARRAPFVAVSARLVRVPPILHGRSGTSGLQEEDLWFLSRPRFVHVGLTAETRPPLELPTFALDSLGSLAAKAQLAARSLHLLVLGAPTHICVPTVLFDVVEQHLAEVSAHRTEATNESLNTQTLQAKLRSAFHPWGIRCEGDEADITKCATTAFLGHVGSMLRCGGLGEWLRRVSDDMRVLDQPDVVSPSAFQSWADTRPETVNGLPLRVFYSRAITQAVGLYTALCQLWGCTSAFTLPGNSGPGKATFLLTEPNSVHVHSDALGAETDSSRAVGLGTLASSSKEVYNKVWTFLQHVLSSPSPLEAYKSTGDHLAKALCPSGCAAPAISASSTISGHLALWQQWAVRYVRLLLLTPLAPHTPHKTSATTSANPILAVSAHSKLTSGAWSDFARKALSDRASLSVDFALSRVQPSVKGGSGPGAVTLSSLMKAPSSREADLLLDAAIQLIGVADLTPLLRQPLLQEGQVPPRGCFQETRRLASHPMYLSRAIMRLMRTKRWEMGSDSIVDLLDSAREGRLQCALKGLEWLEEGWTSPAHSGIVESKLHSWVGPNTTAEEAAWHVAALFSTEHRCIIPEPTIRRIALLVGRSNVATLAQRVCDALYHRFQHIVFHQAINLVDTSGTLLLQATHLARSHTECLRVGGKSPSADFEFAFAHGESLLWRVPCFGCSGFTRETVLYLPPLIEDKGLPMTLSVGDTVCLCTAPPSGARSPQPQDMYVRARSLNCDNRCTPFLKSGTTTTLDGHELERPIWSGELYAEEKSIATAFYAQRQRYYREAVAREINIVIDSINPDMLYSTDLEISGFSGVDVPTRWNADRFYPPSSTFKPIDAAIERSVFRGYGDLGVDHPSPAIGVNGNWSSLPTRRLYRICRGMYEADRISTVWMRMFQWYCDEIWVPANWVRRMFINSFVIPQVEIAFAARSSVSGPVSDPTKACLGCVDMSPAATPYAPMQLNLETAIANGVMGVNHSLERLESYIAEESWGADWIGGVFGATERAAPHHKLSSTRISRLLLDGAGHAFPARRNGGPAVQLAEMGSLTQGEVAAVMSYPVGAAIQRGEAHLIRTHGPNSDKFEIGNATHVLSARMRFTSHFDLEKIVVVPEAIDVHSLDPALADSIDEPTPPPQGPTARSASGDTPTQADRKAQVDRPGLFQPGDPTYGWERWCSRRCFKGPKGSERFLFRNESFRFYSVFKWEPRKGWRELLESFYRAFYSPLYDNREHGEPMLMILGTSYTPKADTFESVFLSQRANWLARRRKWPLMASDGTLNPHPSGVENYAGRADFPCMCFVAEPVSEADITALYKSVDALIVTTRGEGWGLPGSEAMAMGLPIISTNWGGSTEFMTLGSIPDTRNPSRSELHFSYPVNVTVDEVPSLAGGYGGEEGMRMASPSIDHSVELLREVYSQGPDVNRQVGLRSRDVIIRSFSQQATSDLMTARLAAVTQDLRSEGPEELGRAMERQRERLSTGRLV